MKKNRLPILLLLLALVLPLASCGTAGGKVRLVSVTSRYPARPEVTNEETHLQLNFQNPTNTEHRYSKVVLDSLNGPEPELVFIPFASSGPIPPKGEDRGGISLFTPLEPGKYRVRYAISSDNGETRHEFEFDVIKKEDAKPPRLDRTKLTPMPNTIDASEHISMTVTNPDTIHTDEWLHVRLECDQRYTYGDYFRVDIFLNGKWYMVPYNGVTLLSIYYAGPFPNARNSFDEYLSGTYGPLPAGRYRLVKEFDPRRNSSGSWDPSGNPPEYAYAEFTLEQDMPYTPIEQ